MIHTSKEDKSRFITCLFKISVHCDDFKIMTLGNFKLIGIIKIKE